MKIAFLIEGRYPIYGGGQSHVEHLTRNLIDKYNYSVDLFTRNVKDTHGQKSNGESIHQRNMRIIRTGSTGNFSSLFHRIYWLISVTVKLYQATKSEKYDIIHAHSLLPGIPAKIIGWLTNTPVIYTVHGTMHLDKGVKNFTYFIEYVLVFVIRYDAMISVSKKILTYRKKIPHLTIIYNGVDTKKYASYNDVHKYPGSNFLFVGRIDRQKNLMWFVEMLKECDPAVLKKRGFHWNIVGDGNLREKLLKTIEKYGLSPFITWKGPLFGEKLIREYHANHVFILPSAAEGQPITLLEAMASGLAILATDVGDNKEFITNGNEGYLVDVGNISDLKNKFEMLLNNSEEREQMGLHNKEVAQKFEWEHVTEETNAVYAELLARK